jgi:chromate reductase, NAD(P)H dehydrogenase (quinone)
MSKILAVAGSFRKRSYNRRVLDIAVEGAREAGVEVTVVDLLDYPMPVYNDDHVEQNGFDPMAAALQDVLWQHDGLLIASPEYNGSLPGGFKNVIDWTSRKSDKYGASYAVFKGKTAAIITAAPSQFGGLRCMAHLRGVLTIMGIAVLASEIAVTFVADKFDGDGGEMTDDKMRALLKNQGTLLAEALKTR